MHTVKDLEEAGIYLGNEVDKIYKEKEVRQLAKDSFADPSAGVPEWFTTVWTDKVIEQIVQKTAFTEVSVPFKQGDFSTSQMKFPIVEYTGEIQPYADYSIDGQAGANVNWIKRDVYRFETTIQYGDLETETMASAKIDIIGQKRKGEATKIALSLNEIGFFGVSGLMNYGLLNDPSLNPIIPASAKAGGGTRWANATFAEIWHDIQLMWAGNLEQCAGQARQDMPVYLMVTPKDSVYMGTVSNQYGMSVNQVFSNYFPNGKVIQAVQYETGLVSGNKAQLILGNLAGNDTVLDLFSYKFRSHGVVRWNSHFSEKVSASSAGAGVIYPAAISTMSGV